MTKKSILTMKLVAVLAALSSINAIADTRWKDPQTGTQFMLLGGGPKTFADTWRECRAKGWDLFNYEYLSPEAQERFIQADALRELRWEKKLAGEPGERSEATIWGSSESGVIVTQGEQSRATNNLLLQHFADEPKPRPFIRWAGPSSGANHGICMYQSHTWTGCSHEIVCREEKPDGGTFSWRYSIYEYGPHQRDAMTRLKERAKHWPSTGARCELALKDPYCLSYR